MASSMVKLILLLILFPLLNCEVSGTDRIFRYSRFKNIIFSCFHKKDTVYFFHSHDCHPIQTCALMCAFEFESIPVPLKMSIVLRQIL